MPVHRSLILAVLVPLAAGGAATAGAADDNPESLLRDAAASLAEVRSFHLSATSTDADGTLRITADVLASGNANLRARYGESGTLRLRRVASTTYLRGDAKYWRNAAGKDGAEAAKGLANRWIKISKSEAAEFADLFREVSPKALASCLVAPGVTGTLTEGPQSRVGTTKARVLVDAGDQPGTAPGKLFLAASGKPLPLRVLQTGKVRPGGKSTRCANPEDTTSAADFRLSRYNAKLTIRAPKDAVRIPSIGASGGQGSSKA